MVALRERVALRCRQITEFARQYLQAEGGIADRARNVNLVARQRAATAQDRPLGGGAKRGDRKHGGAIRADRIAAREHEVIPPLIHRQTVYETFEPGLGRGSGQCQPKHIGIRHGTHGREIGEIDPEQLARNEGGRIVGLVMNACDHDIVGHHECLARRRAEARGIVRQAEGTGQAFSQWRQQPRDQREFTFRRLIGHRLSCSRVW